MEASEIIRRLSEPFPPQDIDWRVGRAGKTNGKTWCQVLAYLNARSVMDRLDDVVGPSNWKTQFDKTPNDPEGKSVLCTLYLRIDGEWIGKADAAQNSDIEPVKGGISDSFKRAAVHWGIGRYLYGLTDTWGQIIDKKEAGAQSGKIKVDNKDEWFWWLPPRLPEWAMPTMAAPPPKPEKQPAAKPRATKPLATAKDPNDATSPYSKAMAKILNHHCAPEEFATFRNSVLKWMDDSPDDTTADQKKALEKALSAREDELTALPV